MVELSANWVKCNVYLTECNVTEVVSIVAFRSNLHSAIRVESLKIKTRFASCVEFLLVIRELNSLTPFVLTIPVEEHVALDTERSTEVTEYRAVNTLNKDSTNALVKLAYGSIDRIINLFNEFLELFSHLLFIIFKKLVDCADHILSLFELHINLLKLIIHRAFKTMSIITKSFNLGFKCVLKAIYFSLYIIFRGYGSFRKKLINSIKTAGDSINLTHEFIIKGFDGIKTFFNFFNVSFPSGSFRCNKTFKPCIFSLQL